jgi:hypothetical protein
MPSLLNEDAALKALLTGMTVSDSGNAARPVGVWYGQPDPQIRQQSYPYITIDLIGVSEATERNHVGIVTLPYTPEGYDPETSFETQYPIPVDLMYQVTTFARQPRHDRQIISQLFGPLRLPLRFGMIAIPEDGTVRRLDMLGFSKRDFTETDKRLFSNVYTVSISAEFLRENLNQIYQVLYPPTIALTSQDTVFTQLQS